MIIWSSINCPTVICLPTVCYFSREKSLVKSTAPGSLLYYIFLQDLFLFAFIFRSINPKIQKYLAAILSIYFISRSCEIYLSNLLQFYLSYYPWGIDNPSFTSGCKYLFFVCRRCLCGVVWFSYWFDNLDLITEGNTYHSCVASSLPLWGKTDVVQANIKRNFWHSCQGASSTSTRFLITNLISLQFTLFSICLSFSSPPLHKNLPFYSPPFSFAIFLPDLSAFMLSSHNG